MESRRFIIGFFLVFRSVDHIEFDLFIYYFFFFLGRAHDTAVVGGEGLRAQRGPIRADLPAGE